MVAITPAKMPEPRQKRHSVGQRGWIPKAWLRSAAPRQILTRSIPRRGATAIEAAIVLPLAITLFLAGVDYSRAIQAQISLTSATRAAAETGATQSFSEETRTAWETKLTAAGLEEAASIPSFDPERLHLQVTTSGVANESLQVEVEASYTFSTLIRWPGAASPIVLRHRAGMHQYR